MPVNIRGARLRVHPCIAILLELFERGCEALELDRMGRELVLL